MTPYEQEISRLADDGVENIYSLPAMEVARLCALYANHHKLWDEVIGESAGSPEMIALARVVGETPIDDLDTVNIVYRLKGVIGCALLDYTKSVKVDLDTAHELRAEGDGEYAEEQRLDTIERARAANEA